MNLWSTFLDLDTLYESIESAELSDEQKTFFRNSKIRDRHGNLMIFYHGTDKDFDTFDSKFIGKGGPLGTGFYFTSKREVGDSFGKVKAVYLNITNPMIFETAKQPRDFLWAMAEKYNISLSDLVKEGKSLNSRVSELLQKDGYDGVLCHFTNTDEYWCVAYSPEQIKSLDNLRPTTSGNIHEGMYDSAPKLSNWVLMPSKASTTSATTPTPAAQAVNQPTTNTTNKYVVTIVSDKGKLRALATDGVNPVAFVAFPNNLRNYEGQKYEVEQLIWNGKNYRVAGEITLIANSINPTNSVSNTQSINENNKRENSDMNLHNVFEELNRLYEEEIIEKIEPEKEEVADEEVVEENTKTLTEATDEDEIEVEIAEEASEEVEEDEEEVEEEIPVEDAETVKDFISSISEYDGDLKLEFKPIVIDGKEYNISNFLFDDSEEGKLVAEVIFEVPEEDEEEVEEEIPVEEMEESVKIDREGC